MRIYTYDGFGFCKDKEDYSSKFKVIVNGPLDNNFAKEKIYNVKKVYNNETNGCQNKYEIITTEDDIYKKIGLYDIKVKGEESEVAKYLQTCHTTGYAKFYLEYIDKNFDPDAVVAGDTVDFIINGYDKFGNLVNEPLNNDLKVTLTKDGIPANYSIESVESNNGEVIYHISVYTTGELQMHLYYKDNEVSTVNENEPLPIWIVASGPCIALENNENFDLSNFTEDKTIILNRNQYFRFKCHDEFGNEIDKGGEKFISLVKYYDDYGHISSIGSYVIDNGDGYYYVRFIPESYGKHVASLEIYVRNEYVKYGDEITLNIKKKVCNNSETLCPNTDKCVSTLVECIDPPNGCLKDKPFYCDVNGVKTCVASQTECDCPKGFFKCQSVISTTKNPIYWPGYCVPDDAKHMCPNTTLNNIRCKQEKSNYILSIDGKCRDPKFGQPSQRVCPIGKVLCSDFSCRDSYD
ncbi:MAG: hypothetical protein HUJ61_03740, partial [Bacilli bacterium]|nr:hypothetical protein [Bacilli bacterium]